MQKHKIYDTLFSEIGNAKQPFVYHRKHKNVKLTALLGIFRHCCYYTQTSIVTKLFNFIMQLSFCL